MTNNPIRSTDSNQNDIKNGAFVAGIIILAATLIVVFLMLHHPSPGSHSFADKVDEFGSNGGHSHKGMSNVLVHGGAIAIMGLYVFAFSWLSTCLGWNRTSVRLAMLSYTLGALGMIAAAMVSGFIMPFFLGRYDGATPAESEMAIQVLRLLRDVNRCFDQLGVIAMSSGVLFFAIAMLCERQRFWIAGILGVIVGLAGMASPVSGHFDATVHGIIAFVILQGIWNITVAILLMRWRDNRKPNQSDLIHSPAS